MYNHNKYRYFLYIFSLTKIEGQRVQELYRNSTNCMYTNQFLYCYCYTVCNSCVDMLEINKLCRHENVGYWPMHLNHHNWVSSTVCTAIVQHQLNPRRRPLPFSLRFR